MVQKGTKNVFLALFALFLLLALGLSHTPIVFSQSQTYYNIFVGKPNRSENAIYLRFTQYFEISDFFFEIRNPSGERQNGANRW